MQKLEGLVQVVATILFLAVGLVQVFAIVDGLERWLDLSRGAAWVAALFLGYFPAVGSILGFFSAMNIWHWHWFYAFLLFFWWVILFGVVYVLMQFDRPSQP